ncbi:MAG: hypothetical protein AAGD88_06670 [Bacteroidota bacterium]
MRNDLPKNLKIPALFGILFYLVLFLGRNSELLNKYPILNLIGIFALATFVYALVFGVLKNPLNLAVGAAGAKIAGIVLALLLPFGVFIYQRFYYNKTEEPHKSLLEKENIAIVRNAMECGKNKYGTFTDGMDTVIRFKEKGVDFEQTKSFGKTEILKIMWADSCLYYAINDNGVVLKIIQLGNFDVDGTFDHYLKPGTPHRISDEKVMRFRKID